MESVLDEDYIFGISEIDIQHDEIEGDVIALQLALKNRASEFAIGEFLERLQERLSAHFALEESVMHLLSLPETTRHSAAHEEFLHQLALCKCVSLSDEDAYRLVERALQRIVEQLHRHDLSFNSYIRRIRTFLCEDRFGDADSNRQVPHPLAALGGAKHLLM